MNQLFSKITDPKIKRIFCVVRYCLIPLASTTLFYLVFYAVSAYKYDVQIVRWWIPLDFKLQLVVAYILFALSRKVVIFLVIHGFIMGILYVGNAINISFFGGPIMPDDIYALPSLLLILKGWRFFAAMIPVAGIIGLVIYNFNLRHWTAYVAILVAVMAGAVLVYKPAIVLNPIDKRTGHSLWDQRHNYIWHGATLFTLQEVARYFALAEVGPDADVALQAAKNLVSSVPEKKTISFEKTFAPRNIHLILLESFWDPAQLKKAGYSENPLSPEFRELWKNGGYSTAMPPVFGHFTANSEFEVLCGFPVTRDSVKFERHLQNSTACLPHILANKGYLTVASHPNIPVFWNRVNAYRNIGFQTYWSINDFKLDDLNREMLSDASLYRQVLEKISPFMANKKPVLDYIVTFFGHWDYPLSASRPKKIISQSKVEEVGTYANTIYYKSRELMAFIDEIRKRDPESIIVAFGDHLPLLGKSFAGYVESGVLAADRGGFTPEMFKLYVSTPMLIIDGKNGPVKFGSLPLYEVPKLLLELLNYDEPTIFDYASALPDRHVRPLAGLYFNVLKNGSIDVCKEPPFPKTCQKSSEWLNNVTKVSNDLFIGRQFTMNKQPAH